MQLSKTVKSIGALAAAVVSIAAAGAVFGLDSVPRPAWSSELVVLASDVVELDSRVTSQQLDDAKLAYFQNLREQAEFTPSSTPDYLLEEQTLLERRIDELENRLESLRSN